MNEINSSRYIQDFNVLNDMKLKYVTKLINDVIGRRDGWVQYVAQKYTHSKKIKVTKWKINILFLFSKHQICFSFKHQLQISTSNKCQFGGLSYQSFRHSLSLQSSIRWQRLLGNSQLRTFGDIKRFFTQYTLKYYRSAITFTSNCIVTRRFFALGCS